MHALFFEVRPHPGHMPHYFDHVARLKPVLARHEGLVFLDRYRSLADPDVLLSHQLWQDEAAIAAWRRDPVHRASQSAGRHVHFADYRIRVAERVLHWQKGSATTQPRSAAGLESPLTVALYGTRPVDLAGFAAYESVNNPGQFVSLTSPPQDISVMALLSEHIGAPGMEQAAAYLTLRDYGLNDRTQAPQ